MVPRQTYRRETNTTGTTSAPKRPPMVTVSALIDKYRTTNAQFKEFVDATGYGTFAEKSLSKEEFPIASRANGSRTPYSAPFR